MPSPSPCLDSSELRRLLHATGPAEQHAAWEEHLGACPRCQEAMESLAGQLPPTPLRVESTDALAEAMARLEKLDLPTLQFARRPPTTVVGNREPLPLARQSGDWEIPEQMGKYEVRRVLGRGGMGIVLEGRDTLLDRPVALKIPAPALIANPEDRQRFLREARAIAAVAHEHIVAIYAVEQIGGFPVLAMELVEGQSLAERLAEKGPLPWDEARRVGVAVAAALDAAHTQGIVHRDVKPGNILLESATGRVKITDFGLAKATCDATLTATGVVAGTPEFMAPELIDEQEATAQSDLFSLGVVLYQMCTGKSPFRGETALATMRRVAELPLAPLAEIDGAVPEWFSQLVAQMTAKDPAERPASARAVVVQLQSDGLERGAAAVRSARGPLRTVRSRRTWAVGLVVLAALVGFSLLLPTTRGQRSAPFRVAGGGGAFATLSEAVAAAADGATIEIDGNGPYRVRSVDLGDKRMVIRAAPGSTPVLMGNDSQAASAPLLHGSGALRLEGLEIRWSMTDRGLESFRGFVGQAAVAITGGELTLKNCRIVAGPTTSCVGSVGGSVHATGVHFIADAGPCMAWRPGGGVALTAEHCVWESPRMAILLLADAEPTDATCKLTLRRNTVATTRLLFFTLQETGLKFDVVSRQNAYDVDGLLFATPGDGYDRTMRLADVLRTIRAMFSWEERDNGYRTGTRFLARGMPTARNTRRGMLSLSEWQRAWGGEGSFETEFVSLESAGPNVADAFSTLRVPATSHGLELGAQLDGVGPE